MTELQGSGGFWNRVRRFFQATLGPAQTEEPAPESSHMDPLSQLLKPLDQLRHDAVEKVEETGPSASTSSQRKDTSQETRELLKAEILELHQRLGTSFTLEQLEQTAVNLKAHCQAFRAPRPDELTELAMLAVMARLHREALEWAWSEFARLLEQAGLPWPEPEGLTPHADAEQVERHRELHRKGLREAFVSGSFARLANLLLGHVPAWGGLYPTPHGSVWRETVYEAVAGALACRRLAFLESLAETEHTKLETLMASALSERLKPLQDQLGQGVGSIAEARRLSDEAVSICQRVAPDVVWEHLRPLAET